MAIDLTAGEDPASTIACEINNGIAVVTFNRPARLNALSPATILRLNQLLPELETDPEVKVVVVRGAGDHFMAGGDVKIFHQVLDRPPEERRRLIEQMVHALHPAIFALRRMPKPVVASVHGACAGFGVSMMSACDLAIVADSAYFSLAYCHIGTSPDGSSTYSLPRIVGLKKAMELALLGDRFDAAEALRIGLVNWVVPAADLEDRTAELAVRLALGPTHVYGNTKRMLNASFERELAQQLLLEAESFADCAAREDFKEGVSAFVAKRMPRFTGR